MSIILFYKLFVKLSSFIKTEYVLQKYTCQGCGKNSTEPLPLGVPDSAFGPKLMGVIS